MLYAILCYHNEDEVMSWSKEQDEAVIAKRKRVQQEMVDEGRMGPVVRLMPTSAATTIRASGSEQLVLDGPFAETKEQLLGFYVVECETLDDVIDFAKRMKDGESGSFEIRPLRVFLPGELSTESVLVS